MATVVEEKLKYQIALTLIPGVGDVIAKNLVSYCGSAEAVFKQKEQQLLKIPGIGSVVAQSVLNFKNFERTEEECLFIEKNKINCAFYTDKNYPTRLKNCMDAPVLLFYKGNIDFNHNKIVSIVGTRNATDYGKIFCEKLVDDLKPHNAIIVSGLAYGIDITAHKAALKNNLSTVAVLAHGLDRIYPPTHKPIADKMLTSGGLVTEFVSETNPDKENFPKRNRIVAGIADAVIVVEAAKKGGALITAEIANSYNRDVFALPGRIGDTYSEGCNNFIKTNKASLIESIADLEYLMRWDLDDGDKKKKQIQKKLFVDFTEEEQKLVSFLNEKGKQDIDSISIYSDLPVSKIASTLLNLEFKGVLKSHPGKMYELI
jgi:DNA processing protein